MLSRFTAFCNNSFSGQIPYRSTCILGKWKFIVHVIHLNLKGEHRVRSKVIPLLHIPSICNSVHWVKRGGGGKGGWYFAGVVNQQNRIQSWVSGTNCYWQLQFLVTRAIIYTLHIALVAFTVDYLPPLSQSCSCSTRGLCGAVLTPSRELCTVCWLAVMWLTTTLMSVSRLRTTCG